MVGRSLSEQRWSQTNEAAEPKVTDMILQAQAERSGAKGEGCLMAERAARRYKMVIIINNKPFFPPILIVREKTVACVKGRVTARWVGMSGMKPRSFLIRGPAPVFKN